MTSSDNPTEMTLHNIQKYFVLEFNDETPAGAESSSKAHQKGVIAFDSASSTGFYLLHSTPKWPNAPDDDQSFTNDDYAQHYFCTSIDLESLNVLGDVLFVTRPQIYYDSFDHSWAQTKAPSLYSVLKLEYDKNAASKSQTYYTAGNQKMMFYYKNAKADIDLWSWIAGQLKKDMLVETWLRDSKAKPYCEKYSVEMAKTVQFNSYKWGETQDHSKWGVDTTG